MISSTLFMVAVNNLSAANLQLILAILLAVSEALGADPRVKSNGIISFIIIQLKVLLRDKRR